MSNRRVVVTGVSAIAANGIGTDAFWTANKQGKSGLGVVSSFDTSNLESHLAGEVKDFDPNQFIPSDVVKRVDRFVHLGLSAAQMAIADSGIKTAIDPERIGVIMGSGLGGVLFHEEQMIHGLNKGTNRLHPFCVPKITPNAVASHIGIFNSFLGPNLVISTACASGSHAVGESFRKIKYGEIDACICGGVEAPLTQFTYASYCALRVVSKHNEDPQGASRPFDQTRDGFVLSEGAGVVVLEELNHALKRGAPIYAEVLGFGQNSGGHHMVMPDPEGKDAARAIIAALRESGLRKEDITYINAHATSTQANDSAETKAIKDVFGDHARRVAISSTKSMIGHTIGAAGGIEAVVCAMAIKDDFIPPTINYRHKDPACDLDYVPNEGRQVPVNTVLSNSFGFGNCNACLIFSKWKE